MSVTVATGENRVISMKKQTGCGVPAATGAGATILHRSPGGFSFTDETEGVSIPTSNSLGQPDPMEEGMFRVSGQLPSPMLLGAHSEIDESIARRDFTAGPTTTASAGDEITTQNGNQFVRAAGGGESFLTDGWLAGMSFPAANLPDAANNDINLTVTAVAATVLTVAETLVDNAVGDADAVLAMPGHYTFNPTTARTKNYFTIDDYDLEPDQSTRLEDVVWTGMSVSIPGGSNPATVQYTGIGRNGTPLETVESPWFTTPTEPTVRGLASPVGTVFIDGVVSAVITDASFNIDWQAEGRDAVGSQLIIDIFYGKPTVGGSFTAIRIDNALQKKAKAATRISILFRIEEAGTDPKDFKSFYFPKCRIGVSKGDDEKATPETITFSAEHQTGVTGGFDGTFLFQDSTLS